ncbi:acyl-protein thioesterase 1,2 [Planoprotostelium fungivorum]|uniref:Acyl-protein thioesterase 1,2 n=1 Tax=Planoprotostelium fungivorum TaxID=1890364 RepID=A0A2P6N1N1_9EUKA|nr:acyl-protein thioesterase 1,2 [Planoprotostelium fungivorum]
MKPIIISPTTPSKGTVIFLHGLGDTGAGWAMQWEELSGGKYKVILPTAPKSPVTLNGGYRMTSWHDICGLETIDDEKTETFAGIEENRKFVEDLITTEINAGTPAEKIILGGFSQGAALSLYTGTQSNTKIGGIIALSGYLPHHQRFDQTTVKQKEVPIFVGHGTADQVVHHDKGKRAADTLKTCGRGEIRRK